MSKKIEKSDEGAFMAAPTFSLMTTNGKNLWEVAGKVPACVPPA
jgi:hypothetical protein